MGVEFFSLQNIPPLWLYHACQNLPDFQLSLKSKMELSVAISNSEKFRKFKFAKLFCVLIFPEVKNNDSNDTLDDEVQKAVLYTQRYFFLKEMDVIFTLLHMIKCV